MRPPEPSAGEIVVAVDRDSVAAGDDAWSHRQWWVFPAHIRVDDLLLAVLESRCWASIAGGATWIVELRGNHPTIELAAILDGHRSEDTRVLPLLPRGGSRPLADLRRGGHGTVDVYLRYLVNTRLWSVREASQWRTLGGTQPLRVVKDDDFG